MSVVRATGTPSGPTPLPGGLVLRAALEAELEQIGELLTARGDAHDAVDHRLVVEDPDLGWDACAVVVDGERVVATATLLDEQVRVGDVVLPAGQVELVAVDREYEHRGLARALMGWAHERSAARGHLLQVMIGIPYFYRLFGYEYAIDIPPSRLLARTPDAVGAVVRDATEHDLPALVALQDAVQARADVAVPHPPARWRAVLRQTATHPRVLERDGVVVASARVRPGDGLLLAETAAVDEAAALALLAGLARQAADAGEPLEVVERPGTVTSRAWDPYLRPPPDSAEQYYVRIADVAPLLDALRPVLAARLAGLGRDERPPAVVVSTFGAHYRMPVLPDGTLGPVEVGGPMQDPGARRAFGVAPDQLGALLLGSRGLPGLRRIRPDVYGDAALGAVLFPPMTADVLSYYLPW